MSTTIKQYVLSLERPARERLFWWAYSLLIMVGGDTMMSIGFVLEKDPQYMVYAFIINCLVLLGWAWYVIFGGGKLIE